MKQDDNKNKILAESLKQFTDNLNELNKIAAFICDLDLLPKNYKLRKNAIRSLPFYDMPLGYLCSDGQWRYLCSDGKYRTYEEMVNDAAPSQHQGTLAIPQQSRQTQQNAPYNIVANIRAAVAKALRYGQRKRGERE
jgi:hypothetical protein